MQLFLDNNLIYIIERKSISDLLSSLNDGRYREQKMRVLSNIKTNPEYFNTTYLYLLEGKIQDLTRDLKKKYYGTLISLQLRDKITIFKTDSVSESIEFLIRLLTRLVKKNDFKKIKCNVVDSNKTENNKLNCDTQINNEICNINVDYLNTIKSKKR